MKRFMAKVSKSFKGGQKGFTLIELLIVIVILGVLAAAIIPNLSRFLGTGNVAAANAELASVRTGIAAFQAENDGAAPDDTSKALFDADLVDYVQGIIRGTYDIDAEGNIRDATWDDPAAVDYCQASERYIRTGDACP